MVLSVLSAEFSRAMRDDAIATQNLAEEIQARGVALSRPESRHLPPAARASESDRGRRIRTPSRWTRRPPGSPTDAGTRSPTGAAPTASGMIDEGGKISLNRADEALLRKVFETLGLKADEQEEITDAIIDWRDSDDLHRLHGAEDEYYMKLPEPYHAKNGPFDSVDELLQVRGITRELFYGQRDRGFGSSDTPPIPLRDVFSVFNRSANINVRTAPVAVLRVVLGGDEDAVEEIRHRARRGSEQRAGLDSRQGCGSAAGASSGRSRAEPRSRSKRARPCRTVGSRRASGRSSTFPRTATGFTSSAGTTDCRPSDDHGSHDLLAAHPPRRLPRRPRDLCRARARVAGAGA